MDRDFNGLGLGQKQTPYGHDFAQWFKKAVFCCSDLHLHIGTAFS